MSSCFGAPLDNRSASEAPCVRANEAARPLAIDLCCGLGGWAEGFLAEGYDVIGYDTVRRPYPAQLLIRDIRILDGYQFSHAAVIVASPPCDDFSRWDQPWPNVIKNRKPPDFSIWQAAERIAREAGVPLIIENVRGAQQFMGTAKAHFGKQYLWGDVPALLPPVVGQNYGRQKQVATRYLEKAERAKIPFPLARHIAQVFKPDCFSARTHEVTDRQPPSVESANV